MEYAADTYNLLQKMKKKLSHCLIIMDSYYIEMTIAQTSRRIENIVRASYSPGINVISQQP